MPRRFGILALAGALVLVTGDAWAQAPAGYEETVRTATTSVYGDTGLWFVPTGEVLRDGTWSASGYRVNWDVRQGFTDISHFEGTFGFGIAAQDGDFRGCAIPCESIAIPAPSSASATIGTAVSTTAIRSSEKAGLRNTFGDVFLGGKFNLMSESRLQTPLRWPCAAWSSFQPVRQTTARGPDNWTYQIDFIVSKEVASVAEVSGSLGYRQRGDPDEYDLSSGIPFGVGAQFPTRSNLKFTTEWFGEFFNNDVVTRTTGTGAAPANVIG